MDHKDVTAEKLILTFTIILPGQKATKTKGSLEVGLGKEDHT